MIEDVRIRLDTEPYTIACNHDPSSGTLERIDMRTYRCRACGMLFKVGTMEKAVGR